MGDQGARPAAKFVDFFLCSSSKAVDKRFFHWKTLLCKEMKLSDEHVQWRCQQCSFKKSLCSEQEVSKGMLVLRTVEEEIPSTLTSWCEGYKKSPELGGQFEKHNLAVPVQSVVS